MHSFEYKTRIEPQTCPWAGTQPNRTKLCRIGVNPCPVRTDTSGDLRCINKVRTDAACCSVFK